jgi:hypothetical protein
MAFASMAITIIITSFASIASIVVIIKFIIASSDIIINLFLLLLMVNSKDSICEDWQSLHADCDQPH